MDRGAWSAIVHGVARVGYDLSSDQGENSGRKGNRLPAALSYLDPPPFYQVCLYISHLYPLLFLQPPPLIKSAI